MWQRRAEPPLLMSEGLSAVPVQMWRAGERSPVQMWHGASPGRAPALVGSDRCKSRPFGTSAYVTRCMSDVACCTFHVGRRMLHVARCMLYVASCTNRLRKLHSPGSIKGASGQKNDCRLRIVHCPIHAWFMLSVALYGVVWHGPIQFQPFGASPGPPNTISLIVCTYTTRFQSAEATRRRRPHGGGGGGGTAWTEPLTSASPMDQRAISARSPFVSIKWSSNAAPNSSCSRTPRAAQSARRYARAPSPTWGGPDADVGRRGARSEGSVRSEPRRPVLGQP